ncbi:MAG: type II toxin-antitoxin system RelE/ParE family toxin [Candidatus Hadarchaeales archaeon]
MYSLEIRESVDRIFRKLAKKDKRQMLAVVKKIEQVCANPYHFKPLRAPMQHLRRVHVGSFVLVYSVDEKRRVVTIEEYAHHDEVYLRR